MRDRLAAAFACALLSGCSLAPDYHPPEIAAPAAYQETGNWTQGTPRDAMPRAAWWQLYGDSTLDGLEARIDTFNPTLVEAAARYDAAEGYLQEAQSAILPALAAGGHADTDKQSAHRPLRSASQPTYYGDDLAAFSLVWDIDLWGRIRNQVEAGKAEAQASFADVQTIRLSLEAMLADDYLELREMDAQARLLRDAIGIYGKALKLTNDRHDKGIASGLDVNRAQTQFSDAQAQLADVEARRALFQHAIASLVGMPPSGIAIPAALPDFRIPNVPAGIPSTLLQRRPDIAAAERRVAATNAGIGVARAAFFPDISLSALAGFQNTGNDGLFNAPDAFWALGPSAALTLFDNGRHEGALAVAKATNRAAAAAYRATVLRAFQDVEDNMALLNRLSLEADAKAISVAAAQRTQSLSLALYSNGALGFLDVIVAQTTALAAEQAALTIKSRRLQASVGLISAIGGGWAAQDLPGLADTASGNPHPAGICDNLAAGPGGAKEKQAKGVTQCAS